MAFQGFSKKAVQYLHDVYQNNSKAWYEAHKKDFEAFMDMHLELCDKRSNLGYSEHGLVVAQKSSFNAI